MKIIALAKWIGLDEQRRQRGGTGVVIDVDGIRFFSLHARSPEEAEEINKAANRLVNEGRIIG